MHHRPWRGTRCRRRPVQTPAIKGGRSPQDGGSENICSSDAFEPGADMAIRVGNAPVSWGVYEADRPNPPFAQVLDEIARAGYEGTELGPYGYLPTETEALGHALSSRGLALGSSFVALPLEDPRRRQRCVDTSLVVAR